MQKSRHTLLGDHIDILHGRWILYHFVRIRSLNRVWKICYYIHLFHVQVHNILNVSKWRHICWIIFTIWPRVANWKSSPTVDIMGYMAPYLIRVYRWKYIMIRFNGEYRRFESPFYKGHLEGKLICIFNYLCMFLFSKRKIWCSCCT